MSFKYIYNENELVLFYSYYVINEGKKRDTKVPFHTDKQACIQVSKYQSKIIMPEKKSANYVCKVKEYLGSCKVAIDCQIIYIKH